MHASDDFDEPIAAHYYASARELSDPSVVDSVVDHRRPQPALGAGRLKESRTG